jgi:polyisoprenoid-binding protein YceI
VTGAAQSPVAAGTWVVSDSSTRATFTVANLGRAVTGSVAASWGEVVVDASGAPVRARAELDLGSVCTGVARRDADLRGPRFLDAERHPVMAWTAERFSRTEDGGWTADGVLALRGTSAPLSVRATPEAGGSDGGRLRIRATAVLDRRSVGIRAPALLVGRQVWIDVDAELTLVQQRPPGASGPGRWPCSSPWPGAVPPTTIPTRRPAEAT